MKFSNKILIIIILGLSTAFSAVEAQSINYKAVVKDGSGNLITNDLIQVQFNILKGTAQTNVYSESHSPTTDDNGIIIVDIGEGTLVSGSPAYASLDWSTDTHFLQVLINIGEGLVDMGTTEFKAVPYAITSGDKSWDKDTNGVHLQSTNVGIGTSTPSELLEISDVDIATVKLTVPSIGDTSKIEFANGNITGAHSFFKIENRSDNLRFEVDTDLSSATGYESKMTLSSGGLALESGTRINAFSIDGTLADDSNSVVPTERAVKTYVDNSISAITNTDVSKTIVIPATAFTANQSNEFVNYRNYGAFAQFNSGNGSLIAPIIIPQGATITSVRFYLRDGTSAANVNLECAVLRASQSASIPSSQFTLSTYAGFTSGTSLTYSTPFIINNDTQYILRVRPTSAWSYTDLGVCSVRITYTE